MAGNSQRRGATRKTGKKASVGTGGKGKRALEGKGPTPKAEDRVYHPAYQRKRAVEAKSRGAARRGERPGRSAAQAGGSEVVTGRNSVLEALRAAVPVEAVYVSPKLDSDERTREILAIATNRGYDVFEAGKSDLDTLTEGAAHQGVALKIPPYQYRDAEDLLDLAADAGQPPLLVALDGITDPRNLGAILRSAGAFGSHGVIIPERRSAGMTAAAWKVSAGAAARVPVARATNLSRTLSELKKSGCFVVGLDAGGDADMAELAFAADPLVLVVGSEGKGLSRLVRETCDAVASIPIAASTESLNASVAAGIALYEVAKERR